MSDPEMDRFFVASQPTRAKTDWRFIVFLPQGATAGSRQIRRPPYMSRASGNDAYRIV